MDNNYNKLTEESIRKFMEDLYVKDDNRKITLYLSAYEDKDGKLRCPFLEQFDKAMKEEVKNLIDKPFASEEHRQAYINSFNNK